MPRVANGQRRILEWGNGANCVTTDAYGNVYIVGGFNSPILTFGILSLINANAGYGDIFLAKYDSIGNLIWAKSAGGTDDDESTSIKTDANGNVYITGYFISPTITFGSTTLINAGGAFASDIFIAKYDSLGNVVWAKRAGGGGGEYSNSLTLDAYGNIYITGQFNSSSLTFGTTTLINSGSYDIFLTKYDIFGNVLWAKSAGGTGYDYANSVTTDTNSNIYITGVFGSPTINFDAITLTNVGSSDIFLAKYHDSTTIVTTINQETRNITLFPNPTNNNQLTLACNSNTNIAAITITDVLGRQVYTQTNPHCNGNTYNIFLPALPGGVYYLHAICGNGNECLPFVVGRGK